MAGEAEIASWGIIATFQWILQPFVKERAGVVEIKLQVLTLNFL